MHSCGYFFENKTNLEETIRHLVRVVCKLTTSLNFLKKLRLYFTKSKKFLYRSFKNSINCKFLNIRYDKLKSILYICLNKKIFKSYKIF